MARYIDADKEIQGLICALERVEHNETTKAIVDVVVEFLEKAPTADVAEVVHAYFKRNERNIPKMREFHEKGIALSMSEKSIFYTCSRCGNWCSLIQEYCYKCGAKLDGRSNT